MYQIREANQMVEEFMLAANVSVADKILKHFSLCSLLRRHPSPTREMLEPLLWTAAAVGLNLDVSSSKALADCGGCFCGIIVGETGGGRKEELGCGLHCVIFL
ncbi:hypothetical protein ACJW30_06G040800 [Castanea mollissima]